MITRGGQRKASFPAHARAGRSSVREVIARSADPPPPRFALVSCVHISQTESLCADGLDKVGDCLVNEDDPDCQSW